jgi:hypothetical protein
MPLLTSLLLFPKIGPNIDKVVVGWTICWAKNCCAVTGKVAPWITNPEMTARMWEMVGKRCNSHQPAATMGMPNPRFPLAPTWTAARVVIENCELNSWYLLLPAGRISVWRSVQKSGEEPTTGSIETRNTRSKSQLRTHIQLISLFAWNVDTGPTQVHPDSLRTGTRIVNCWTN